MVEYPKAPRFSATPAEWDAAARRVLLDMLNEHHAVTVSELEARASDRTWNSQIWPRPIDPHHFTNARRSLAEAGMIAPSTGSTRGGSRITTWTLAEIPRGRKRATESAAARKRLLSARHAGWGRRGGSGLGLIGKAGEAAVHAAMTHPDVELSHVTGSTRTVLGVDLLGEIDNSARLVVSEPSSGALHAIQIVVEVKNLRSWLYADSTEVRVFLAKAAHLQDMRRTSLILPVLILRKSNQTLRILSEETGFIQGFVHRQLVQPDHELTKEAFTEVRDELGYQDLTLWNGRPTNYHVGIFRAFVPTHALARARLWQRNYVHYLPDDPALLTAFADASEADET